MYVLHFFNSMYVLHTFNIYIYIYIYIYNHNKSTLLYKYSRIITYFSKSNIYKFIYYCITTTIKLKG